MEKNYTKMSKQRLLREFEKEKKNWFSLPRRSSYSGLAVSSRLDRIQQLMVKRRYSFKPVYMEITIEVG
jgi:hypothetical protein